MKTRPVIIAAASAFVLSFFTSLIFKSGFGFSLLKGIIFAVVFGAIAVGVQILFEKFLAVDVQPASAHSVAEGAQKTSGSKIDLVVGEEELPDEEGGATSFNVDRSPHVLLASDVGEAGGDARHAERDGGRIDKSNGIDRIDTIDTINGIDKADSSAKTESVAEEANDANDAVGDEADETGKVETAEPSRAGNSFVAFDLTSGQTGASAGVSDKSAGGEAASVADASDTGAVGEVGSEALPELGRFAEFEDAPEAEASQSDGDDGIIDDAADDETAPLPRTHIDERELAEGIDSSVMASAIRTVLAKEK